VSVAIRDQVLRTADRTVAEQAPPNVFFRTAFPVVEHLHNVRGELDGHHLVHAVQYRGQVESGGRCSVAASVTGRGRCSSSTARPTYLELVVKHVVIDRIEAGRSITDLWLPNSKDGWRARCRVRSSLPSALFGIPNA
jgi:hypothetical protein